MGKKYPVNRQCPCGSGKKYKKCHGSPVFGADTPLLRQPDLNNDVELVAYTDESGNSGNNLFDAEQPDFWTGTLVTRPSFEAIADPIVAKCLDIVKKEELHGNALGLGGINKIAGRLLVLFRKTKPAFLFTKIEKTHLAATKFADAVLDSGTNRAMSLMHYGPPAARLPLALSLIQLLDDQSLRDWWDAFGSNDPVRFSEMMRRPLERLEQFHREGLYHDRTAQLLRDALTWGISHPVPLLEGGIHELDSPNIVALTLIVDMLHRLHEKSGGRVRAFIHDEQNEFAHYLKEVFHYSRSFQLDNSNICAPLPDIRKALTFSGELRVANSRDHVGLQLIDTVLWLVKRFVELRGRVHGDARKLAIYVITEGDIHPFERRKLIEDVREVTEQLYALPLTEEKMKKGKELVRELEARRVARMNSEDD